MYTLPHFTYTPDARILNVSPTDYRPQYNYNYPQQYNPHSYQVIQFQPYPPMPRNETEYFAWRASCEAQDPRRFDPYPKDPALEARYEAYKASLAAQGENPPLNYPEQQNPQGPQAIQLQPYPPMPRSEAEYFAWRAASEAQNPRPFGSYPRHPDVEARYQAYKAGYYTPDTTPLNFYQNPGPGAPAGFGIPQQAWQPGINGQPLWGNVPIEEFPPDFDWQDAVRRGLVTRDQVIAAFVRNIRAPGPDPAPAPVYPQAVPFQAQVYPPSAPVPAPVYRRAATIPAQIAPAQAWDWENSLRRRAMSRENLRAENARRYVRDGTAPVQGNMGAAAGDWERRRAMGREAERAAAAERDYVVRRAQ